MDPSWASIKLGIGLCNNQDALSSEFFWSFLGMIKPTNHVVIRGQSRLKAASLNRIVEQAWKWKVDKLLFLDVDQTFEANTIPKLISRNLPIVSGVSHIRGYPYTVAAGWMDGEKAVNAEGKMWKYDYAPFPDNDDHLVEVDWTGVSCLLVDMQVFNKIYFPCFKEQWDDEIGDRTKGHDTLFCAAAKEAGYKIYVDTLVQCGHLCQQNIDDLYVETLFSSNFEETEKQLVKDKTLETAYWDNQYSIEKMKHVRRTYSKEWELMLEEIPGGSQVAEVGCGMGSLMELIKKNGSHPHGYDFSKIAVDTVKSMGFSAETADLRAFKPNGQAYDVVIGSHILEHMKDDIGFLQTCASMLNGPASKVIMSVPSDDRHPISLMEHQHNYTEDTLHKVMSAVFKNVEIKPVTKERFGEEIKPAFVAIGSEPHGL